MNDLVIGETLTFEKSWCKRKCCKRSGSLFYLFGRLFGTLCCSFGIGFFLNPLKIFSGIYIIKYIIINPTIKFEIDCKISCDKLDIVNIIANAKLM